MSLRDNNVLVGKQVLYTILGNNVLNLQTQGFRPKKEVPTARPHATAAGLVLVCLLCLFPARLSPLQLSRISGFWGRAPLTWLSEVTKCCTVCPSAVVISWMYAASSCGQREPSAITGVGLTASPRRGGSTARRERPHRAGG